MKDTMFIIVILFMQFYYLYSLLFIIIYIISDIIYSRSWCSAVDRSHFSGSIYRNDLTALTVCTVTEQFEIKFRYKI